MSLKDSVLSCLEQNRDKSMSGEQLAEQFNVSRAAVWKAIKNLRDEGYLIEAVTNKGYRLSEESNRLSQAGILSHSKLLTEERLIVYDEIDSTNLRAKAIALEGAVHGTAIVANQQTAGRGRLGRNFASPADSGIYLSIILRPDADLNQAMLITTAAAVGVCGAIRTVTGADAGIKWVNDIYIGEKKVCGILTEAVTDFETGNLESVVVGIGINFQKKHESSYPDDVLERICWIYDSDDSAKPPVTRNELAAAVIDKTLEFCGSLEDKSFLDDYRKYSVMLGRDIVYIRGSERQKAKALDIDERGGLVVMLPSGEKKTLSSGEISIRW